MTQRRSRGRAASEARTHAHDGCVDDIHTYKPKEEKKMWVIAGLQYAINVDFLPSSMPPPPHHTHTHAHTHMTHGRLRARALPRERIQ